MEGMEAGVEMEEAGAETGAREMEEAEKGEEMGEEEREAAWEDWGREEVKGTQAGGGASEVAREATGWRRRWVAAEGREEVDLAAAEAAVRAEERGVMVVGAWVMVGVAQRAVKEVNSIPRGVRAGRVAGGWVGRGGARPRGHPTGSCCAATGR